MNQKDVVKKLLPKTKTAPLSSASAFAPANITLCKYWGKRDIKLNLPCNSSLSISLANKGAQTQLSLIDAKQHQIIIHDQPLHNDNVLAKNILQYLNLFHFKNNQRLRLETSLNIPLAAGVASSACGFAALVLVLNQLFAWNLNDKALSILASRSLTCALF